MRLQRCRLCRALCGHIKYEMTRHICTGKNRGSVSAKNTHCIFMNVLFHIPISHVRESFTRAAHSLTNYSAPILLGIRRQWRSGAQKNTSESGSLLTFAKFDTLVETVLAQRVKERWERL